MRKLLFLSLFMLFSFFAVGQQFAENKENCKGIWFGDVPVMAQVITPADSGYYKFEGDVLQARAVVQITEYGSSYPSVFHCYVVQLPNGEVFVSGSKKDNKEYVIYLKREYELLRYSGFIQVGYNPKVPLVLFADN